MSRYFTCNPERPKPAITRFLKNELMVSLGNKSKLCGLEKSKIYIRACKDIEINPDHLLSWNVTIRITHFFMDDFINFQKNARVSKAAIIEDPIIYPANDDFIYLSFVLNIRVKNKPA